MKVDPLMLIKMNSLIPIESRGFLPTTLTLLAKMRRRKEVESILVVMQSN